jgi:hypothetical protein
MFGALLPLAIATAEPAAHPAPPAVGNREASLALGFGFPTYGGYYVNPFGFTVEPRFRWAFGSSRWEWLVGPGGRFTVGPTRTFFGEQVTPLSYALGLDTGVRFAPRGSSFRFGVDGWAGLGRRDLGAVGGLHFGFEAAVAPVVDLALKPWLRLGLELRSTFYFAQNPDGSDVVALTPSLFTTARF